MFGLDKDAVAAILKLWPKINTSEEDAQLAINNTLNNLLGYPIDYPERWSDFISVNREELLEMFKEWKKKIK